MKTTVAYALLIKNKEFENEFFVHYHFDNETTIRILTTMGAKVELNNYIKIEKDLPEYSHFGTAKDYAEKFHNYVYNKFENQYRRDNFGCNWINTESINLTSFYSEFEKYIEIQKEKKQTTKNAQPTLF